MTCAMTLTSPNASPMTSLQHHMTRTMILTSPNGSPKISSITLALLHRYMTCTIIPQWHWHHQMHHQKSVRSHRHYSTIIWHVQWHWHHQMHHQTSVQPHPSQLSTTQQLSQSTKLNTALHHKVTNTQELAECIYILFTQNQSVSGIHSHHCPSTWSVIPVTENSSQQNHAKWTGVIMQYVYTPNSTPSSSAM